MLLVLAEREVALSEAKDRAWIGLRAKKKIENHQSAKGVRDTMSGKTLDAPAATSSSDSVGLT